ncbi:MAG: DUF1269 domain-containing protein [Anaerolineales bacterium]|nr:DUF1269 domain-containing protein [Anaerolineales bacterium]
MSDVPVQVVIAAFQDETSADDALKGLREAQREGLIKVQDAAVLRRDEKNKLHVKETGDWGGGKGAVAGGLIGGFIGLLAGPVGVAGATLAGALVGGLSAKLRDSGFSDERLEEIGSSLKPGTSAIVAVIEHTWVEEYERAVAETGADVLTQEISADIEAQLEQEREVAYTALSTDEAFETRRIVTGEDEVEISGLTVTEDGFVAGAAVVTKEGVAADVIAGTEEGVVEETFIAIDEDADAGEVEEEKAEE